MSTLLAGTRYRGDLEERLNNLLKELTASKENILFIDEIHCHRSRGNIRRINRCI